MDTKEEFETSLENIRYLIESTSLLVAMRGWSEGDLSGFSGDVSECINRFTEAILPEGST